MKNIKITMEETQQFSELLQKYLQADPALSAFYQRPPHLSSFEGQLAQKAGSFPQQARQVLVAALRQQYTNVEQPPLALINTLGNANTFTVTTGHQLNIFTGPLYFIYKIVTVINMAKKLKEAYPDYDFVPVYWMATEDHDFAEINHFTVFGKQLQWENQEASGAVGRLSPAGLAGLIEGFSECPPIFKEAYLQSETLAGATRQIVHTLFADHGLLIVDGDHPELKQQFGQVVLNDLTEHTAANQVRATNQALEEAGFGSQAFVRDINLFYLKDNLRERIERKEAGGYQIVNTAIQFTEEQLRQEVAQHPEYFSPNVILRPLYQEMVLPNLAYIGGPAEVAYWLQLKGMFDHFEVPFPLVFPRNFALVIGKNLKAKLDKLKVEPRHLFLAEQELKKVYLDFHSKNETELGNEEREAEEVFARIARTAGRIDPSLVGFVEAETKKMVKSIQNIEKRLKKSEERNHEVALNQLANLKERLFPGGVPQERVDNFLNFYLNDPSFIDRLLLELSPFDFRYNVLEYQA